MNTLVQVKYERAVKDEFAELFQKLDSVFADMLDHLRGELSKFEPGLFTGGQQVYDLGEKFGVLGWLG